MAKKSFAMKTVARIDKKLEMGIGDRVLLEDAKKCLEDDEAYINELERKLEQYAQAIETIKQLASNLEQASGKREVDTRGALAAARKELEDNFAIDIDASLGVCGMVEGLYIPYEFADTAKAKQSGVVLTKRSAIELRAILIRYANMLIAMEDFDPRYSIAGTSLTNWVKSFDYALNRIEEIKGRK